MFEYPRFLWIQARISAVLPLIVFVVMLFVALRHGQFDVASICGAVLVGWSIVSVWQLRIWSSIMITDEGVTQCAGPLRRTLRWQDIGCVRKERLTGKNGFATAKFLLIGRGSKRYWITFFNQINNVNELVEIFNRQSNLRGFELYTKALPTSLFRSDPPQRVARLDSI